MKSFPDWLKFSAIGAVVGVIIAWVALSFVRNSADPVPVKTAEEMLDVAEELSENTEPSSGASETQENELIQEVESSVPTLLAEDINYEGDIQLSYESTYESEVLNIKFDRDLPVNSSNESLTSRNIEFLPAVSKLSGKWTSNRTFTVFLNQTVHPDQLLKIKIKSLPLENEKLLLFVKGTEREYQTPPLKIKMELIDYGLNKTDFQLVSNYRISFSASDIKYELTGGTKNKILEKMDIEDTDSPFTKRLGTKSSQIPNGDFNLKVSGQFSINSKSFEYSELFDFYAAPLKEFKILSASAVEGTSYFSISANCKFMEEGKRDYNGYYLPRKSCYVYPDKARDFIKVEPDVKFSIISNDNNFRLVGKFKAAETYTVTFLPGLSAKYQANLKKKVQFSVAIPDYKKSLSVKGKARYLPLQANANISFESRNLTSLYAKVTRIFPQNIVYWLTGPNENADYRVSEEVSNFTVPIHSTKNKLHAGQLNLSNFVKTGQGVYQIDLSENDVSSKMESTTIVMTDLLLLAKRGKDKINVWVRSMTDLQPKPGVDIRVYSSANQVLGKCESGSDGGCAIEFMKDGNKYPIAIIATTSDDLSYLKFSDVVLEDEKLRVSGLDAFQKTTSGVDAFLFTSRGVYRPGETVEFAGIVRKDNFHAATDLPLKLQFRSPRDKVITEKVTKSSKSGAFSFDIPTQKSYETGVYSLEVRMGDELVQSQSVNIEEFVPERISIDISSKEKLYVGKRSVELDVEANYLFGSPVSKAPYTVDCTLIRAFRQIPNQSNYVTGTSSDQTKRNIFALDTISGDLDEKGKAKAKCDYGEFTNELDSPMLLTSVTSVREAGSGRSTNKRHSVIVSKSKEILGLDIKKSIGQKINIEVQLFDLDGNKVKSDEDIFVSLHRQEYNWTYGYDPDYGYERWHSEYYYVPEMLKKEDKLKDGVANIELSTLESWGSYLVRVENKKTGSVAEASTYLGYYWYSEVDESGEFNTPKPMSPDQLNIAVSAKEVSPGSDFEISMESPFPGEALVCAETDQVKDCKWHSVKRGQFKANLVAPDVKPNFYVTVILFKNPKEGDAYIPARAWGGVSVGIESKPHSMDIALNVPKKIRPNRELEILVKSADADKSTDLFLAIVDEGILQLTNFESPDPIVYFHRERALGVSTHETLGWTFSYAPSPGGGGVEGAGGGEAAAPVRLVSFWKANLSFDDKGEAKTKVFIPPFQGKLRIMAVVSGATKYGSASAYTTVADPIVILPTLPRFLTENDQVTAKVAITNTTDKDKNIVLNFESEPQLETANSKWQGTIKAGASYIAEFPFKVDPFEGSVEFNFVATYDNDKSADNLTIPIIPPTNSVSRIVAVAAKGKKEISKLLPKDLRSDGLSLDITYSPILIARAAPQIESLVGYPYGCIEQTTSKTFPLLVMRDLIRNLKLKKFSEQDVDAMVMAGISRVASMQTYDGGFAYWPGGYESTQWATAYATHMLLTAKQMGYQVSESLLNSAIAYMRNLMTSGYSYSRQARAEPYMAYVLGLAKHPQLGFLRQVSVADSNKYKNLEQDFMIMAAMQLAGETSLMDRFTSKKTLYKLSSISSEGVTGNYYSNRRSRALRLATSEEIWPGDIRARSLARKVADDLKNPYWTTQEMAWGLIGLVRRQNKLGWPDLKIKPDLLIEGKVVDSGQDSTFARHWHIEDLETSNNVEFSKVDESADSVDFRFVGYEKNLSAPDANKQLQIDRTYYDIKGRKLNMSTVKSGDLIVVELEVKNRGENIENIAIEDRIPAALEVENPRLGGQESQLPWIEQQDLSSWHIDVRDNRIGFFGSLNSGGRVALFYLARATSVGEFLVPPGKAEDMYDPEMMNFTKSTRMTVRN